MFIVQILSQKCFSLYRCMLININEDKDYMVQCQEVTSKYITSVYTIDQR